MGLRPEDGPAEGLAAALQLGAVVGRRSNDLAPGAYEFRVRTVDLNGFAQPEPRPYPKSGRNDSADAAVRGQR